MKQLLAIIISGVIFGAMPVFAQGDSARISCSGIKSASIIVPAGLISYGVLAHTVRPFRLIDEGIDRQMKENNIHTRVDDYIQYVPGIAAYGLDFCGVKSKHNLRDRTFLVASSYLLTTLTVNAVKYTVDIPRPDGTAHNSFPSGHTATAFTGAHLLYREYRDISPWIGIAGYATATATGALRVVNRRHWLGDIAAGAGLGILCVEASYLLLPVFHRVVGLPNGLAIAPMLGGNGYGLGLACRF